MSLTKREINPGRYSAVSMALHWAIAAGVIWNWWAAKFVEGSARGAYMGVHKAVGISILLLTIVRIGWRLTHPRPPLPSDASGWERALIHATWAAFYILLITLPLLGWIASSLGGRDISMFGLFQWPLLPVSAPEGTGGTIMAAHTNLGTLLLLLVVLHVAGGLKHTFAGHSGGLFRMLPFGKVGR